MIVDSIVRHGARVPFTMVSTLLRGDGRTLRVPATDTWLSIWDIPCSERLSILSNIGAIVRWV